MKLVTIYLTEEQVKFFKERKTISRAAVIREMLDEYIKKHNR